MFEMSVCKVSVIIPCFNVEKYLAECINSILLQTLQDIEIICVDDCSTDKTVQILQQYAQRDKKVKIILLKENKGSGPARNEGIKHASGEYLAFMDPDDLYPDANVLETLYIKAKENNALICGGNLQAFKPGKSPVYWDCLNTFSSEGFASFEDYKYIAGYCRLIYQRDMIKKAAVSFPDYRRRQDPVFLAKAMAVAKKFYMVPIVTYLYRRAYKKVAWNYEKYYGAVLSFKDCFEIYAQEGYWQHMAEEFADLKQFYHKIKLDNNLSEEEKTGLLTLIKQVEGLIDYSKVRQYDKKIQKLNKLPVFFKNKQADGTREFYMFGRKIFTYKKKRCQIKLGVSYNLFDGEELLPASIQALRSEVDYINVIYQDVSNYGNKTQTDLTEFLKDLKQQGLIDEYIKYEPNLKKKGSFNERKKRNLGLKYAAKYKCTHFISMDTDEFYQAEQLKKAKEYLATKGKNIECSIVSIYTYVQKPIYRIAEPVDGYVSFIVKIKRGLRFGKRNPFYPAVTDPTRIVGCAKRFRIFPRETIVMHHMAYVRKDLHKKYQNSSFNDSPITSYSNRLERISAIENFKPGDLFEGQKVYTVDNIFQIEEI